MFKALLLDSKVFGWIDKPLPVVTVIGSHCFNHGLAQSLHGNEEGRLHTPGSDWMVKQLWRMVADIIGQDVAFEAIFDEVEFIISLVATNIGHGPIYGRFLWRYGRFRAEDHMSKRFLSELEEKREEHPLLIAGVLQNGVEGAKTAVEQIVKLEEHFRW